MKRTSLVLFVLALMVSLFALYGCPKKTETTATPEEQPKAEAAPAAPKAEEAPKAAEPAPAPAPAEEPKKVETAAKAEEGLQPIYFDFDKSFIRADAKPVMKANAAYLKANPKVKVKIEGNCDERGTIEYNQALGQRRAQSAKKYLTDLGIKSSRISLISYGKEKPVCTEGTEDCWQKNRRDDLVAVE